LTVWIIATNTDGIYTKESFANKDPKTIRLASDLAICKNEVSSSKSPMHRWNESKIEAANIARKANYRNLDRKWPKGTFYH